MKFKLNEQPDSKKVATIVGKRGQTTRPEDIKIAVKAQTGKSNVDPESLEKAQQGIQQTGTATILMPENIVKDSQGQDLYIGDTVNIDGKMFKILIGPDGTAWFGDAQNNLIKKIEPRHAPLFDMAVKIVEESYEPTSPEEPVLSVGHIDDEAGMLKQTAYDIVKYGADLYKMLMHYEAMNTHVDFPHWWQSKVIKARDYISAATHYLEYETKESEIENLIQNPQGNENPRP